MDDTHPAETGGSPVTTRKLMDDLKVLARDAEGLLKATAGEMGEKTREARERLKSAIESARKSCHNLEEKALDSARAADKVIREHPYESLGVAFGMGLLIGVLVARK
jgi:ElaB/YqjD/DUF883 family membrane-anchored ribosome-binding protein